MLCNISLPKKPDSSEVTTCHVLCTHTHIHGGWQTHMFQPDTRVLPPYQSFEWLRTQLLVSVDRVEEVKIATACRGPTAPTAPTPASVYWNFKKTQRVWALGCLSPRCSLNHWGTFGLSMHEKVLSTSTLEKAFKKKTIQHPTSATSLNASSRIRVSSCKLSGCL